MDKQGEAHTGAIKECMSESASMFRETCESLKKCVKMFTDSTHTNFQQLTDSTQKGFKLLTDATQTNFQQIMSAIREIRTEKAYASSSALCSNISQPLISTTMSHEAGPATPLYRTFDHVRITPFVQSQIATISSNSQRISQNQVPIVNTLHTTTTALGIVPPVDASSNHENLCAPARVSPNGHQNDILLSFATSDKQMSSTGNTNESTCSKHQSVSLPAFTGGSNDSWKIWHSRFTTIADLNK